MNVLPPSGQANPERSGYDSASLDYREASDRFWGFLSLRTIERMSFDQGDRVLDVACGPGVSAVAAAERVGPSGHVIALDSSEQMLRMARERAASHGLENVETHFGDMAQLEFPAETFDAVVSVLGIFFVPDMPALVAALWRLVKPGGRLAITTLGEGAFEPAIALWKKAVKEERPWASLAFSWERTDTPEGVRSLLEASGVTSPQVDLEPNEISIPDPSGWWTAVMGSSMRRTILEMDDRAAERVRERCEKAIGDGGVTSIQLPGIYALATKP